jgi:DNA-directed RNA polymerase specialized sigma24 family protein
VSPKIKIKLDSFFTVNYSRVYKMANNVCKMNKNDMEDLLQNTILAIYEIDDTKCLELLEKNVMMYYIYGILNNKRSDYYKTLNKNETYKYIDDMMPQEDIFKTLKDETEDIEERLKKETDDELIYKKARVILSDRSDWFANRIFIDMADGKYKSFRDFGKKTSIHYMTIYFAYKRTLQKLKNKL